MYMYQIKKIRNFFFVNAEFEKMSIGEATGHFYLKIKVKKGAEFVRPELTFRINLRV